MGYGCRWTCVSAQEIGAHHIRKRWFFLAHSMRQGLEGQGHGAKLCEEKKPGTFFCNEKVADSKRGKGGIQSGRWTGAQGQKKADYMDRSWWFSEPDVDRVVDGVPFRVDRVKALGNAVVPKQVKEAFERLMGLSHADQSSAKGSKLMQQNPFSMPSPRWI